MKKSEKVQHNFGICSSEIGSGSILLFLLVFLLSSCVVSSRVVVVSHSICSNLIRARVRSARGGSARGGSARGGSLCKLATCLASTPFLATVISMPEKRERESEATEEAIEQLKRTKSAVDEAIAEFVCPITHSLPIDPVTAGDGNVYERHAITDWLKKSTRSPLTNEAMGDKLLPALKVKNVIRVIVKSGAIVGDKADASQAKLKEEEKVEEWRRQAEAGDGTAMFNLGIIYQGGTHGFQNDNAQALAWYRRADAKGHVTAKGVLGYFTVTGCGGATVCLATGGALLVEAASQGSQHACEKLGRAFALGKWGFPVNPEMARRWYSKVAGATIEDCIDSYVEEAAKWLRDHPAMPACGRHV